MEKPTSIFNALSKLKTFPAHKGDIGLEVETESLEAYQIPSFSFWTPKVDNSLRNFGREYVLKQPLSIDVLEMAVDEFVDKTKDVNFIKDSITTSLHVHLNFLNKSFKTLGNFLTLYSMTENLLTNYCGSARKHNMFCLPLADAEVTVHNFVHLLNNIAHKNWAHLRFDPENTKYAALNLSSLANFGSLEQRSHGGVTDKKSIMSWVSLLYCVYTYAQKDILPVDIINSWRKHGPDFIQDIFGEYINLLDVKSIPKEVDKNLWYAVNVASIVPQNAWKDIDEIEPKKEKKKAKSLDAAAQDNYGRPFDALNDGEQEALIRFVRGLAIDNAVDRNPFNFDPLRARDNGVRQVQPADPINWEHVDQPEVNDDAFDDLDGQERI